MADRTAQEALELDELLNNSPFILPDNPSASGWSAKQVKEKFYAGLLYLYKLFKDLRNSNDTFAEGVNEQIATIEGEVRDVLENLVASHDVDGNEIITTYAKIANITNGSIGALKYIKENGQTEFIRKIADDLAAFVATINALFNGNKAKKAEEADKATLDGNGRNIKDTYETKSDSMTKFNTTKTYVDGFAKLLVIDHDDYKIRLKDANGNDLSIIDLPLEEMIIDVAYDSETKMVVFTLNNGNDLEVEIGDLISGLVSTDDLASVLESYYTKSQVDSLLGAKANSSDVYTQDQVDDKLDSKQNVIDNNHKLSSDLVDSNNNTNQFANDVGLSVVNGELCITFVE